MNKTIMTVASAVIAAATWVPAAQAKGGGGHHGGFGFSAMKVIAAPSTHHQHHFRPFRRDTVVFTTERTEELRARRLRSVAVPAGTPAVIRYADGKGRIYDVASKTWCDGNKHCWTGKYAWTFREGNWFYGTARWYEDGGVWKTDAADGPVAVDCETVPVFASIKPTTEQVAARKDGNSGSILAKDTAMAAAPIKAVETSPAPAARG